MICCGCFTAISPGTIADPYRITMLDHHQQIAALEAEIDRLSDSAQQCRKIELLAKAATASGGLMLLATLAGQFRSEPLMFVLGVAAALVGIVLLGSNRTTLDEIHATMAKHEALRAKIIDELELQPVETAQRP
jgi:hypothetical protein